MKRKAYSDPELELLLLQQTDIITTSFGPGEHDEEDDEELPIEILIGG